MHGVYKVTKEKMRPDYFISKYELEFSAPIMERYYPVDMHRARVLRAIGFQVYRFDIQGEIIKIYKVRNNHRFYKDKYYGVLKKDWDTFVKSEESYPFIYLWYMASSEANEYIGHYMFVKEGYMSGKFNYRYLEETNAMDEYLEKRGDKREAAGLPEKYFTVKENAKDVWEYLPLLTVEYANRLYDEALYCNEQEDINMLLLRMTEAMCKRLVSKETCDE